MLIDELQQIREMQKDYRPLSEGRMSEIRRARELQKIQRATDKKLEKILSKKQMDELKKGPGRTAAGAPGTPLI